MYHIYRDPLSKRKNADNSTCLQKTYWTPKRGNLRFISLKVSLPVENL